MAKIRFTPSSIDAAIERMTSELHAARAALAEAQRGLALAALGARTPSSIDVVRAQILRCEDALAGLESLRPVAEWSELRAWMSEIEREDDALRRDAEELETAVQKLRAEVEQLPIGVRDPAPSYLGTATPHPAVVRYRDACTKRQSVESDRALNQHRLKAARARTTEMETLHPDLAAVVAAIQAAGVQLAA